MVRLLAMIGAVALVAVAIRSPLLRRLMIAAAAVLIVYALLKLSGVIDAARPDRFGVF